MIRMPTFFPEHPRGLQILFFSEMWERFGFYGMRALVVLYMVQHLGFDDKKAISVYAAYATLLYASSIIGGMLADKIIGNRNAIITGGVLISLGHFLLAAPFFDGFYLGLGALICGTGLFKSNISSMVGKLYPAGDKRRDSGFTLFYMGINIGALFSPLICGNIANEYGRKMGFAIAGVGMLIGILVFIKGSKSLGNLGLPPKNSILNDKSHLGLKWKNVITTAYFCVVPFFAFLVTQYHIFDVFVPVLGVIVISYLLWVAFNSTRMERLSLFTILTLMLFHTCFFGLFEQAATSLTMFTERNIDKNFLGISILSEQFQSLNPVFIILLAPLFSVIWTGLKTKGKDPDPTVKFSIALFLTGLGFAVLYAGCLFGDSQGMVSLWWLVGAYFLHTLGELCISPIGLSMITNLSPARLVSTIMGIWFLTVSFGNYMAGAFAKLSAYTGSKVDADFTQKSLSLYLSSFKTIAIFAFIMGAVLLVISPFFRKVFEYHDNK